jgi:hypothetical protein
MILEFADFGICKGGWVTSLLLILCFGFSCQLSGTKKGRIGILHNSKRSESEPSLLTQIVRVATQSPRYVNEPGCVDIWTMYCEAYQGKCIHSVMRLSGISKDGPFGFIHTNSMFLVQKN